jgi:hypothetical protein
MERRILKDTTPTLEGYPRLRASVLLQNSTISFPGAKVRTPLLASPAFDDQVVTVDGVDVSTDGDAAVGDVDLSIDSATLVRDRRYLLEVDGRVLDVESRTHGTTTTMRMATPLPIAIGTNDGRLKGFALLRTLTAAETAAVGECSVEWQATIGGLVVQWVDLFRVVARLPKATLTPGLLLRLRPQMRSFALPTDVTFEDVITGAWEGTMQVLLENAGVFDEDVISDEALAPLHALACVLHVIQDDPVFDRLYVEDVRKQFAMLRDSTFRRVSWSEQGQATVVAPRDPSAVEDRGRGIRVGR